MRAENIKKSYKVYSHKNYRDIPQINNVPEYYHNDIKALSQVFPFRVNNYVLDELIDWDDVPKDPIFQLTFPQPGMLETETLDRIKSLQQKKHCDESLRCAVREIHTALNPHPAGQMEKNVPFEDGISFNGLQHKYNETVLFFPTQGQTCHAYCTYCFRWVQFVGIESLKFASSRPETLVQYISKHPELTDILFTGGDPLVMRTRSLKKYIEPVLQMKACNISTIRIGTKALGYWPYRFLTDSDSDELLRFFEKIVESGKHLSIMAHITHPRELETNAVIAAIRRIRETGAEIRCQAPLIRHVNDSPEIWSELWKNQVRLGMVPYYMFIARDTGAKAYFDIPIAQAYKIFTEAYANVSGLCRTVRGPSMSAGPGKVVVEGITEINGEKLFGLKFLQGRNPEWVNKLFYAKFDKKAVWLDDLKPAFGEKKFFFEGKMS